MTKTFQMASPFHQSSPLSLSVRAEEEQHGHLDLHQSRAGERPWTGEGRWIGVEVLALGDRTSRTRSKLIARPIGAKHRINSRQARIACDAIGNARVAVVIGDMADQHEPFHPGCSPPTIKAAQQNKKNAWKATHCHGAVK